MATRRRRIDSRIVIFLTTVIWISSANAGIVFISVEDQDRMVDNASIECIKYIIKTVKPINGTFCEATWDSMACWPYTEAGETAMIPCPNYLNGFDTTEYAYRTCTNNGSWYIHPDLNTTWSDYRKCVQVTDVDGISKLIGTHMPIISMMYNIGYGVSLVSLVLATTIMIMFRKLRCPRTSLHINLFASFMLRAFMSFMKENLLVNGVGFEGDVNRTEGRLVFRNDVTHWQCKVFFTLFYYFLEANYMWILVEGLYLHTLISFTTFSEKSGIKLFVLFGWASPLLFVLPWAIVRLTVDNVLCWNTHPTPGYFWIMRGPIVISIVVNFVIFVNIIRVLFTKLNAFNSHETRKFRYKKLAKSTLVLIPLFGVHYIVFVGLPDNLDGKTELVKLYFEMFFNSIQGFIVALIFCFFNGEVQSEIRKKWRRYKLSRGNGPRRRQTHYTVTSYTSRARGGSLASTTNSGDSKENNNQNGHCIRELSTYSVCNGGELRPLQNHRVYASSNGHARRLSNCEESQSMLKSDSSDTNGDQRYR